MTKTHHYYQTMLLAVQEFTRKINSTANPRHYQALNPYPLEIIMNLKLVESLAQIINSLTPEEQELLIQKTSIKNGQEQDLGEIQTMKVVKKQGKLFEPPLADYIQITRDERTAQQDELIQEIIKEKRVNEK